LSDAGGSVNTLDQLKQRGATNVGDYWEVQLTDTSRGSCRSAISRSGSSFVTEPPRQPEADAAGERARHVRGSLDPRLVVILAICLLFNSTWRSTSAAGIRKSRIRFAQKAPKPVVQPAGRTPRSSPRSEGTSRRIRQRRRPDTKPTDTSRRRNGRPNNTPTTKPEHAARDDGRRSQGQRQPSR